MIEKITCKLSVFIITCLSIMLVAGCAEEQIKAPDMTGQSAGNISRSSSDLNGSQVSAGESGARIEQLEQGNAARKLANEIKQFESSSIYFAFDKADLTPEAMKNLEQKADWLLNHPSYSVRVEGNCDERGSTEYNLALGQRRANVAAKYLEALGVSSDRIKTISYGEENPVDPGHNEKAWAKNRRDDFRLIK
jgi:peptidoglycan-associated lipoprotein